MPMAESEDTVSARSSRLEIRTQISVLGARIQAPEESLAAARCDRENLQSRVDDYKYPVLTLPVEITTEIFIAYLPAYPECPPLTGILSPALLGQICQQWHDVALGTPRLWRAIDMCLDREGLLDAQLNVLTIWLLRSKACSLSISFKFTDTNSERWEYIKIIMAFDYIYWIESPFPLLRDLTFGVGRPPDSDVSFLDTPMLTTVQIGANTIPSRVEFPWFQLTTISVVGCELADVAYILRHALSLVEFRGSLWDTLADLQDIPHSCIFNYLFYSRQGFSRAARISCYSMPSPRPPSDI
ncbi:hypothetical protein C8J57DRAFT_1619224 [Mycena rebaudengoi]|nr:hypothetical protein C8J57DRAFT_1619224 [Mycena rebaudengoi]